MLTQPNYPPQPLTLEGDHVILRPLLPNYLEALREACRDGELWKLWYTVIPSPENMEDWIKKALKEQEDQVSLPFVVIGKESQRVVGSTRYLRIEKGIRRLEIGSTWYSRSAQRTPVNTECKLLLLTHAFETLQCRAVEFRTHRMNAQSITAIERLGARLDGILRNHALMPNGTLRDTAVYSILDSEWPMVKKNLEFRLGK